MSNRTDKQLDRILNDYFDKAEPERIYVFDPDAERNHTPVPPRRFRIIAAAAAVVLVSALSLTVYLIFGNITNAPIAFSPISQSSVTPSERGTDGSETPISTAATGETGANAATTGNTENPTVGSTSAASPTSSVRGISPTSASERAAAQPTQTQNPSQAPTQTPDRKTAGSTASDPTRESTQSPTDPFIFPTDRQVGSGTGEVPSQEPTKEPTQEPTEDIPQSGPAGNVICDRIGILPYGTKLFCRLYDRQGNLLGDPDLYSEQHKAYITDDPLLDYCDVIYDPDEYGLIKSNGMYEYYFYDENGTQLKRGILFLTAQP